MKLERFFSFSVREQTGSMENNMSSSRSWGPDKLDSPHQSLWLQTTLSELEKKMKAMMILLEEDDSSSVERAEIYNNRKPKLIQALEDFNRSYRSLAVQCDQLRSKSHRVLHSGSSTSSSYSRKIGYRSKSQKRVAGSFNDYKLGAFNSPSESVVEDPDVECNNVNFHFEYLNRLADELMSTESCNLNRLADELMSTESCKIALETETEIKDNEKEKETTECPNKEKMKTKVSEISETTTEDFVIGSSEWNCTWHELKFRGTKLMEESLRQQAELLKRNEEKRKTINDLRAQMECLRTENRALQSGLRSPKVEMKSNQFHKSRLSGLIFNKFFKAGCS